MLFEARNLFAGPKSLLAYDVDPSGKRILAIEKSDVTRRQPLKLNLVVNWFDELRRHVAGHERTARQ